MSSQLLNIERITDLCQEHKVENLYIFGSALRDDFSADSDIDFLVRFLPIELYEYFTNYLSLKENLEKVTGRRVDLIEEQTLKNPVLVQSVNTTRQLIYG